MEYISNYGDDGYDSDENMEFTSEDKLSSFDKKEKINDSFVCSIGLAIFAR